MTPRNKLNNPYYFVKDDVIFKINVTNYDSDPCGKHYVTYVTESKEVKKGQTYINENGDYVVAASTTDYDVSTGKINEATCANTFPYFKIVGKDDSEEPKEYTYYFWLDNFIEAGDVYKSSKFMKTVHEGDTESTIDFAQYYVDTVKKNIATAIAGGTSFDTAKGSYPSYLFANKGDKITVNGKEITVNNTNGITTSYKKTGLTLPIISEDGIQTDVLKAIDEKTIEYANGMLKNIEKQVKKAETGNTLIKEDTVVDL